MLQLKALPVSIVVNVPAELRDDLKMCLNLTPDLRPDATQFSKVSTFFLMFYIVCGKTHNCENACNVFEYLVFDSPFFFFFLTCPYLCFSKWNRSEAYMEGPCLAILS